MSKKKIISSDTLKDLIPGMFSPGGATTPPKQVYFTLINTRMYISTDFNNLSQLNSYHNKVWTGVQHLNVVTYKDIPIQLYVEDIRKLRM